MEAIRPAGDRRGAPGSVLRLSCSPPQLRRALAPPLNRAGGRNENKKCCALTSGALTSTQVTRNISSLNQTTPSTQNAVLAIARLADDERDRIAIGVGPERHRERAARVRLPRREERLPGEPAAKPATHNNTWRVAGSARRRGGRH